jgi:eukaryotic-like serine/threonine-protein kinase
MSVSQQLAALEQSVLADAPHLVGKVRGVRLAMLGATLPSLVSTLIENPLTLEPADLDFPRNEATSEGAPMLTSGPERYDDLGPIGAGGMGEVRRVRDRELNRVLAMKVIGAPLMLRPDGLARFLQEAQATAQLQHPAIVPVYDMGRLTDGRVYFTMKEVRGNTFTQTIRDAHAQPIETRPVELRRLVAMLHRASQAVAYAHERAVVHRDLKPDNIMVGGYGEVLVMDWGLVKVAGRPEPTDQEVDLVAVVTDRSKDQSAVTRMGTVAGTPAYMPPEQARGEVDRIDARTDVYALGAILYEVLAGRRPYEGPDGYAVHRQVLQGPPVPLDHVAGGDAGATFSFGPAPIEGAPAARPSLPPELVAACERAMAREPDDRFTTATAFADELQAWLDGARRREQALDVVALAEATGPEALVLHQRATTLREEATALLAEVEPLAPEQDKAPAWAKEDEAADLAGQAELKTLEREQLLQGALTIAPALPEAHAALAAEYHSRHQTAETDRDSATATKTEVQLRRHAEALPEDHDVRRTAAAYLTGHGALTLVTDPPGAEVMLHRYVRRHKRLITEPVGSLGHAPLREVTLPMGSYLCLLRHPGRAEVRYPVHIARGQHWSGVRPGHTDPHPIALHHPSELGPDDLYVPAGWFLAGDGHAYGSLPAGTRLWCDPFFLRRFPVTNREYLAFLDDLVDQSREEEALHWAPRENAGQAGKQGALIYGRDDGGHFRLVPDAEGDLWEPDWPVLMVDWHCATAYAAWEATRTGQPWRLPWDFEWEKAARGVDGRIFPWGDGIDPTYACHRDSHRGPMLPRSVDAFPLDVSPYGVRGLGGNGRDWCVDHWTNDGALPTDQVVRPNEQQGEPSSRASRVSRGGRWSGAAGGMRAAYRYGSAPSVRNAGIGFRLARARSPQLVD